MNSASEEMSHTQYRDFLLEVVSKGKEEILRDVLGKAYSKAVLNKFLSIMIYEAIKTKRSDNLAILASYYEDEEEKGEGLKILSLLALKEAYRRAVNENDYEYLDLLLPYIGDEKYEEDVDPMITYVTNRKQNKQKAVEFIKHLIDNLDFRLGDITFEDIFAASLLGDNADIIDMMLADPRSDEMFLDSSLYIDAARRNSGKHLARILSDERSNPALNDASAVSHLARSPIEGYKQAIARLLEDSRVRAAVKSNAELKKKLIAQGIKIDSNSTEKK